MTQTDRFPPEVLNAYLDGELDSGRMDEVEAYLRTNPDAAARLEDYAQQDRDLAAGFAQVANEPVPARLSATLRPRRALQQIQFGNIAAGIALLLIGMGAGGALTYSLSPPTATRLVASNAISAHATFAVEVLHPVEVAVAKEEHLITWLSNRLGTEMKTPDLAANGFSLMGGRLLPTDAGEAAQFMYEDAAGTRITLYVTAGADDQPSSFKFTELDGYQAFYWMDSNISYAIVGALSKEELKTLAVAAYSQLI